MRRSLVLLATVGLVTAAVAIQDRVNQLQQDGRTISTNLRVVDGTLMVSVKDVASYLGGDVSVANGTATISGRTAMAGLYSPVRATAAGVFPYNANYGGAAQPFAPADPPKPRELTSKVGEAVTSDGFRFTVVSVDEVGKGDYKTQFDARRRKIGPVSGEERLYVAKVRVENASDRTQRPALPVARDMTLFDDQGVGVPVRAFDARSFDTVPFDYGNDLPTPASLESPLLAPQGAYEFAAVFSMPKDRTAKSIVVALPPMTSESGGSNIRIAF